MMVLVSVNVYGEKTYVHAGSLINGVDNKVYAQKTIVIEDERITAVLDGYQGDREKGAVINLKHATVMPGFMDMHTHLAYQFSDKTYTERFTLNEADYALRAAVFARKTLQAGFTTVRDLGDSYNVTVALRKAVQQNGCRRLPRLPRGGGGGF